MDFNLLHPADQLVMIIDRIYHYGMTTTSGGNLSILDDNGDIWITPGGVDKGTLTRNDMICIKPDGTKIGKHKPSVELPFHQSIYKRRPDIKAVLHAHPPALVAFSIVRKLPEIHLIPNIKLICGEITIAPYGVPGSKDLGEKIAFEFDKGFSTVLLENHGVVIGSVNLFKAFKAFETLEYCAKLQINAQKIGKINPLSKKNIEYSRQKNHAALEEFSLTAHSSEERALRRDMIRLIHRSYDQHLFTSTQGTFSVKLSDNSVLITPFGKDRKYLEESDLVLIKEGKKESGKFPSRSVPLHLSIYEKNPDISSILVAHPPHVMSFAVTNAEFDSRTIPESYIMLREVKKVPYGASFMQQDMVAALISSSTPVLICENDCVIVTGTDLLNAFDRLEVFEYSAHSIIAAKGIGEIVPISQKEVADLNEAFGIV